MPRLQAPLFTQKADLFHRSIFVVGYDTALRLVKPEYYGSDQAMLLQVGRAGGWLVGFFWGGGGGHAGCLLGLTSGRVLWQ